MLDDLKSLVTRRGNRPAGAAIRRLLAVCALGGVLAATLAFAPAAVVCARAQVTSELAAAATQPLFAGFALQGGVARLRISMRNTGRAVWDPAQGIRLRRLDTDGTLLAGESYPVEGTVQPGETAHWDIIVSPQRAGVEERRYGMYEGESAFGSTARAVIVVVPNLEATRDVFRLGIGDAVETLTEWAGRTFGDALGEFAAAVRSRFNSFVGGPGFGLPGS